MISFERRTAVVTGAAHGIGLGIAQLLVELGADVTAVDVDGAALRANCGDGMTTVVGDLSDTDTGALATSLVADHGPFDLIVNNVGIDTPHAFLALDEPDYDRVFATNLRGPWFFTKSLVGELIAAERPGAIVFISSLHDTFVRGFPHYSASKAAVAMLARELAVELAPHRIRVNSVSPGVVRSAHVVPQDQSGTPSESPIMPLGRIGEPDDVARMVAVLLSDTWSGYVTGVNLRVDGGLGLYSWSPRD